MTIPHPVYCMEIAKRCRGDLNMAASCSLVKIFFAVREAGRKGRIPTGSDFFVNPLSPHSTSTALLK